MPIFSKKLICPKVRVKFSREESGDGGGNNLDDEVEKLREKDEILKEFKIDLDLTK